MKSNIKNLHDPKRSEKNTERHLTDEVKKAGGLCLKFSSMTETGYPDRIVLFPGGLIAFVELKSKGKKPTRLQDLRHEQLREMGFPVYVIDHQDKVADMLNELSDYYAI